MINLECLKCKKNIKAYPSRIKRGNGKYCSRICKDTNARGKPPYNKGKPMSHEQKEKISIAKKGKPGWKHTDESKRKISESRKGDKNHFWMGGVSTQDKLLRNSVEYKIWRCKVFMRDNFTCQECGKRGGRIEADHIKSWKLYKKDRFKLKNGRTLCKMCHTRTPNYGWRGRSQTNK